ncbi:MAG: T9SS type A sorting domain-containing protein [Chitinophagales bacterium]
MKNLLRILTLSITLLMFSETKAQIPLTFTIDSQYLDCDSAFMILTNTTDSTQNFYYQWNVNGDVFTDPYFGNSVHYGISTNQTYYVSLNRYQDPNYQVFIDSTTQTHNHQTNCNVQAFASYTVDSVINCNANGYTFYGQAQGGTGPYTFVWIHYGANGATTYTGQNPYIQANNGDLVELQVSDANNDSGSYSTYVYSNNPISAYMTYTFSGAGCNSSFIDFSGFCSEANAIYDWQFDVDGQSFYDNGQNVTLQLSPNSQYLIAYLNVSTPDSCFGYDVQTIQIPISGINGSASFVNNASNTCNPNSCDYEVTMSSSDGVAPLLYSLNGSPFTSSAVFSNLCAGFYTGSIEDANGCIANVSINVEDSSTMYVSEYSYFASCDSGGQGGNSYMGLQTNQQNTVIWSDGFVGAYYANPSPGSYNYIVVDSANGCSVSGTFVVPQSNCYTISGNVFADLDGDCIFNNNDYALNNVWVDLADAAGTWLGIYDYTDANGNFSITAPAGTYYFDINGYNTNGFTQACPATGFSVTIGASNPNATVDFFMTPPAPVQDLSVSLYSFTTFTPGFPYWAYGSYCNDGTIPMSGSVIMTYDAELTYIAGSSGSLTSHDATNRTLTWDFTNLMPGACYTVYPDFTTSVSAVLGTTMSNTIVVNPITGDQTPANNTSYVIDTVVGSWDPNDKAVSPNGDITVDDKDHSYHIRFQNEGTAPAVLVVVRDNLDDNLDIQTLRNVSASHNFVLTVENTDELVFTFNNIMLPAKQDDEPGSNGSINFTISQKENLPLGTVIENTAAIYFDFNEPVITNTTVNTITEKTTGISNVALSNSISVYPNPSNGNFNIQSKENIDINNVKVYDLLGQIVFEATNINTTEAMLSLQNVVSGVYLLKLETAKGNVIEKINISK